MKLKVLVVDDEYLIKKSLNKMISESEHGFIAAGEAEDGLEALELAIALLPDLIVTDINMPIMDGLELIQECRNRNLPCEIIVLSGYGEFEFAQQALRFGVSDYLLKPVEPQQLDNVLRKVREKYDFNQKVLLERSNVLQFCNRAGGLLANLIWDLDEKRMKHELTQVYVQYAEHEQSPRHYNYLCFELLAQIEKQLAQLGAGINYTDLSSFQEALNPVHARSLLESCVNGHVRDLIMNRNHSIFNNMKTIVAHIEQNYLDDEISLQKIAERMNISVSYASQLFKEVVGESYVQYLTRLRMEKAKELLRNPDCKTYEAALTVGYNDYPHFTRTFKKYFGFRPKDYRKRIYNQKIRD